MSLPSDIAERDNYELFASEAAGDVVYRRPDAGTSRPMTVVVEKGNMSSFRSLRQSDEVRRKTGRVFLWQSALSDFGGKPEYRDEIDIDGETWTVMQEISRDAGVIEAEIETDLRATF